MTTLANHQCDRDFDCCQCATGSLVLAAALDHTIRAAYEIVDDHRIDDTTYARHAARAPTENEAYIY